MLDWGLHRNSRKDGFGFKFDTTITSVFLLEGKARIVQQAKICLSYADINAWVSTLKWPLTSTHCTVQALYSFLRFLYNIFRGVRSILNSFAWHQRPFHLTPVEHTVAHQRTQQLDLAVTWCHLTFKCSCFLTTNPFLSLLLCPLGKPLVTNFTSWVSLNLLYG